MRELEDLSQVQRQFVSDVSHELRTPLTTIRIASDVLLAAKDEMDPAAGRSAELLQSQLERFESLLTDLLEISRYDANAATLDAEPVDVCTIVLQSADVAQQLAERRGTKIEFRLPAEPCIAEVDRAPRRADPAQPAFNAVEHGEARDTVVTAAMDSRGCGHLGAGLRRRAFRRARSSWSSTGSGALIRLGRGPRAGPVSGWRSRLRMPGSTTAGSRPGASPGKGSVFRLTLPRTVGGELHGSPLPLSPYPVGIDAAELPDLGEVAEEPSLPPAAATTGLARCDYRPGSGSRGRADRRYDPARCDRTRCDRHPAGWIGTPSAMARRPRLTPCPQRLTAVHAAPRRPTSGRAQPGGNAAGD